MVAEHVELEWPVSDLDGRVVAGRYRLTRKLGSGAMGAVWVAVDERLGRTIALKELLLPAGVNETETERARQRALREGRIAARIRHPNAITVYDVVDEAGRPVLIMEYLPSRSLAEVLTERGPLPPAEAARIGSQVASALAAAHDAGIVHRDIKPANILLGDDGTTKVTDFGISRAVGDVTVTATGLLAGTPAYLSPEAARGAEPSPASDVFSLGATLYKAVEGAGPFGDSDNAMAVLHAVASGRVKPPRQAGPLTDVLMQMLRTDPKRRPTMGLAHSQLNGVAEGRSVLVASRETATVIAPESGTLPSSTTTARFADPATGPLPPSRTRDDLAPVGYPDDEPDYQEAPRPSRKRGMVAIAMAAVAVLAVAAVLFLLNQFNADETPRNGSGSTAQPVTAEDYERAVSEYYDVLPDDTDAAWKRLGPGPRSQGRDSYDEFWSTVSSVSVIEGPTAEGDTVTVKLELEIRDKGTFHEVHRLGMITGNGKPLIESDDLVSSDQVGGDEPTTAHEEPSEPPATTEHSHEPTTSEAPSTSMEPTHTSEPTDGSEEPTEPSEVTEGAPPTG